MELIFLLNKFKLDCMPRDLPIFDLDNLKLFGNKFCKQGEHLYKNLTIEFSNKTDICPWPCDIEFISADSIEKLSPGIRLVNFMPKPNLKTIFTYHLSMDFNNFIYDVGGTIGMWIGYSAITPPMYLYKIYEILKNLRYQAIRTYFIRIFDSLLLILEIIKLKTLIFCEYLTHQFKRLIIIINNLVWSVLKSVFLKFMRKFQNRVNPQ